MPKFFVRATLVAAVCLLPTAALTPQTTQTQRIPQFENDDVKEVVQAHPAIFLRDGTAEQAGRAGLQPELAGNDAILFPLGVERNYLVLHEAPDGLPEDLVFLAKDRALDHCQKTFRMI